MFVSCEKEELANAPASERCTVLVYLGVDNNFRAEASQKIEMLTENWDKNFDGNLLVYSDTGEKPVLVHIHYTERYGNIADTIEICPIENSSSPAMLTRVLNKTKEYFPAASYGLIVLSHATGWLPADMSDPAPILKSVILDKGVNEANNYMELTDFADAIPYKLDFIIFDACFMGSIEVACELKDKVDYIVASPAEVLSPGFVYFSMMKHLFKFDLDLTAIAREFYEYYAAQSGLYQSATVSVVRTAGLETVISVFCEITDQILNETNIMDIQTFGYGNQKIYFDLGDYVRHLSSEKYNDFQSVLNNCILYKACTGSYYSAGTRTLQEIKTFSGLSIYIPQTEYAIANEAYKRLKWAKRTSSGLSTTDTGI
jgi:hypothetical protein